MKKLTFYKNDLVPVTIFVNDIAIKSTSTINIFGVTLVCKLQWGHHIDLVIHRANKAVNAIKLISEFSAP